MQEYFAREPNASVTRDEWTHVRLGLAALRNARSRVRFDVRIQSPSEHVINIYDPSAINKTIKVQPRLVVRESTGPVKK